MIEIRIAYPNDPMYEKVSHFAREEYLRRIQLVTPATPNFFAYAQHENNIIGCVGLYCADTRPEMFFEMCNPPKAYERLSNTQSPNRMILGEIGTYVILMPDSMRSKNRVVSIALNGVAISVAYKSGIRYIGFVTNRMAHLTTEPLGFSLAHLGEPDYSNKDHDFQNNMKGFLRTKQYCAGFQIKSLEQCRVTLVHLSEINIRCVI